MSVDKQTVQWLLRSENSIGRYYALKDLMDEPENSSKLERERKKIPNGPHVTALFSRQQPDGGFGVHPYTKWTGAHWRLVSLVEQGIPPGHPKAKKMTDQVLDWLASEKHRTGIVTVEGRARVHASMEGNALASCSRLGLADDPRAGRIGDSRAREALDILLRRRRKDGRWQPGAYYWRRPNSGKGGRPSSREWWEPPSTDVVDWGRGGPNEMIALNALRVLKAAGRFNPI